jgi:mRNA interferase RelE/StbE
MSSHANVTYTKTAIKALRRMPTRDRDAIMDKVKAYGETGVGDVKALQGSDLYRLRHGNWRAIFTQDGTVLAVLNVAKRGEVYR